VLGEFLWVFLRAGLMALGVACAARLRLAPESLGAAHLPFIAGFLSLPCAAIGLLATSWVRNINQFQTVYSFPHRAHLFPVGCFLSAPRPAGARGAGAVLPFYHGVRLIQCAVWGQFPVVEILQHPLL
jgi:hypothetical protein